MEKTIFTGVREQWLPLYNELKGMTEKALGGFEVRGTEAAMLWRHDTCFAEIGARKDCMIIAFASGAVHDEWEPVKVLQTSKNRFVHYFEAAGPENFPALVERIQAAYTLTKSAKPPKREAPNAEYRTIDEYIALFEPSMQEKMQQIRRTIREAAPEAVEKISWSMPTFYQGGNLIHFAAAKTHLGVYPGSEVMEAFRDKLTPYATAKGSIHLPWDKPLPHELIAEITRFQTARCRTGAQK
ncbi:MAG: DUF5655 domain-containing protein [Treponema sp.]|jgi:uncharacterized protein YdhG (YjbR/CyaY superfamily)|nr:DUF5655 domain-containing protein [Treponema sp.]